MYTDHDLWINIFDEESSSTVKMELSEVVKRILINETPEKIHIEAAKALAVAVRTKIIKRLKLYGGTGCETHTGADICTSMDGCSNITNFVKQENSIGSMFSKIYELSESAARETSGVIITCGGRPIEAVYHLACGGGTENSEDVLGNSIMYLRKVLCKYCSCSPGWEHTIEVPVEDIESKFNVKVLKDDSTSGPETDGVIGDVERDETGRVRMVRIGSKYFTGSEVRDKLGLSSTRFGWDPVVLRFRSRGSGSGLGMCLYGANQMSMEGCKFDEIIRYYYTNIKIQNIDIPEKELPLKGKTFIIDPGHGGESGEDEKGEQGLREAFVNLDIAYKLSSLLEKSGAQVKLTREDDVDIPLIYRVKLVNDIRPSFLISIHQNSFFSSGVSGTEVYFYKGDAEGEKLAEMVIKSMVKTLGTRNRGLRNADFYLLRESKVSSILVECMYISNALEERRLAEEKTRNDIAGAIYSGIMDYYGI